jgi:hypothetical protein
MDRRAKVAIGAGLVLTAVSLGLVVFGDFISWIAGAFNESSGVAAGKSLAGMGELIIVVLVIILVVTVGSWIYSQTRSSRVDYW